MRQMKSVLAIAALVIAAGAGQMASAQATFKTLIIGASGAWSGMALGAYNNGKCPDNVTAGTCGHASFGSSTVVNVIDTRPPAKTGGALLTDTGASIWLVWDNYNSSTGGCASTCNVWAYVKVDSVVGNRCYFATPRCELSITSVGTPEQKVPVVAGAWPSESGVVVPANVATLLTSTPRVNVAASEIRPEDASFAECRVNSPLGGANDGLAGLGYGTGTGVSGACPTYATSTSIGPYVGTTFTDAISSTTAHPVAFNISGHDPITNSTIPAFTTVDIGAYPVVFIVNGQDPNGLLPVTNVTENQLQSVFSGTANCIGSDLGNPSGTSAINVYQREPLSGTMNGAEYTTFRLPRDASGNYDIVNGASQEANLGGANPITGLGCNPSHTGPGTRTREIGNGDETTGIKNSFSGTGLDGIGYMYFTYSNVASLGDSTASHYLTINNADPIFQIYYPGTGSAYDPAQPFSYGAGALPKAADLPSPCQVSGVGTFPCPEPSIWKGGWSYPNIRNGSYRNWIMIRLIGATGSTPLANAQTLVASTQATAVIDVPDFVPALETIVTVGGTTYDDPGLKLRHSHYTQAADVNPVHNRTDANGTESGGDVGGCLTINASTATSIVYRNNGITCVVGP